MEGSSLVIIPPKGHAEFGPETGPFMEATCSATTGVPRPRGFSKPLKNLVRTIVNVRLADFWTGVRSKQTSTDETDDINLVKAYSILSRKKGELGSGEPAS